MVLQVIHWISYGYFLYVFAKASLLKVFQSKEMLDGMEFLGFNRTWTLIIGYTELMGVLALVGGLWFHQLKNGATIFLLFFAAAALTAHLAHRDYADFYEAIFGIVSAVVILTTDKYFRVML